MGSEHAPEHTEGAKNQERLIVNRLGRENSPYLLQHASNPVAWQPWDDQALTLAKELNRPILLSIGYSSCHWCHVMAHESFENQAIADVMNAHFICIKVDREERPDIDSIYMEATMRMTGSGGWPMTLFLTPDGAPFFAGTYFPPTDRYGAPGFPRLAQALADWYHDKPDEIREQAEAMRDIYHASEHLRLDVPEGLLDGSTQLDPAILARAANADLEKFDSTNGGLKGAPKFPHVLNLEFLLRLLSRRQAPNAATDPTIGELRDDARALVILTLDKMADGGIHDQLGGGFHRYSTDAIWLVPHFEKMLYDNALLALVYLRAWQTLGVERYRAVAQGILDYILHEMTAPSGAFYSSQDADSEGEEGRFYIWSADELRAILSEPDASVAQLYWGVSEQGNFEKRNILHVARSLDEVARRLNISGDEAQTALARAKEQLYAARAQRVWPGLDDKAITSWNALALRAFAEAARTLGRDEYRAAAEKNAAFLMDEMWRDGRLLRSWRQGTAKLDAYLEDYAGLANALISDYELNSDARAITRARELADAIIERFWDESVNGFFDTASGQTPLIGRPREMSDNVTPSGASLACEALLRLSALTGETRYHEIATRVAFSFAPLALRTPGGFGRMLSVLDDLIGPFYEVALVGKPDDEQLRALRATVESRWRPRMALAVGAPGDTAAAQAAPLLAERPLLRGAPAAYVCQGFVCQRPVSQPTDLEALLDA